jgi:hypothetical protein
MTIDTSEIQSIISESFENLYFSKLESEEETDSFHDTYHPPN